MIIASILENQNLEKRIAITPEISKKYSSLGFKVLLPTGYGKHLGIKDEEYEKSGTQISKDEKEILNSANVIVQLSFPKSTTQENYLGIRPENLKLVSNGGISGNVFGIEYLGSRKIVTIETKFGKIKVRVDSNVNLKTDENVQFIPSNDNQIIFDGKTDKSLISEFLN